MKIKLILFLMFFLFTTNIYSQEQRKFDLNILNYNLSSGEVIQLWGNPDRSSEEGIILYEYETNNSVIYLNFFTDDKLSCVWEKNNEGEIREYLTFKHSFFEESKEKGEYKLSGYESEKKLLKKGYVQKYFYFSQLKNEVRLYNSRENTRTIEKVNYYAFREDRIVYSFYLIENSSNNTVCAYIICDEKPDEKVIQSTEIGFIKYDVNGDGVIENEEGDWFNNRYFLEIKNKQKAKFISFDYDKNGITEKNEGHAFSY